MFGFFRGFIELGGKLCYNMLCDLFIFELKDVYINNNLIFCVCLRNGDFCF